MNSANRIRLDFMRYDTLEPGFRFQDEPVIRNGAELNLGAVSDSARFALTSLRDTG